MEIIETHYREHRQKLMKKLTFRAGSEAAAEDILQEAYYRALKYYGSYTGEIFGKWFSTIVNNSLREYKNKEKNHLYEAPPDDEVYECPNYSKRLLDEVFQLVATKSVDQQDILNLYMRNGYSAVDISRITEHSYPKCHKTISRFRDELKQLYGE